MIIISQCKNLTGKLGKWIYPSGEVKVVGSIAY